MAGVSRGPRRKAEFDSISGGSWTDSLLPGYAGDTSRHFVATDTGHFNIIASDGTVVGRVSTVEHAGSNGSNFSFDFGNCEAPND